MRFPPRHRRLSWWRRIQRWLHPADTFIGATYGWSPATTWNNAPLGAPEETALERAERISLEIEHARLLEEERILAAILKEVHAEFEEAFVRAEVKQQIDHIGVTAAATLATMRKTWGLSDADMGRAAKARRNKAGLGSADRFLRRLRGMKAKPGASVHEQLAASILSPTGPMPIVRRRETAGAR